MRGRIVSALALAAALLLGAAGQASAKPPVWIVRSHGATVVLFGSIHLLPAGLDWRPPALVDALGRADALWFELPITMDSDNAGDQAAEQRGHLGPDASLLAMMDTEEADKLRRVAERLHLSIEVIDQMEPWLAEVTISVADDAASGASAFNGVEDQIQAIAPISTRRGAFETAPEQIGFLAGAPLTDQIASLEWTLHEVEDDPATYQRVVDEWMGSDLAGLQRDALDPLRRVSPALYDRLIAQRNHRWAKALKRFFGRRGETTVVVVGVGHLIGPDGLPTLLRAEGLEVEGP
jgi:uncharacterized protein YbaP (TraB family)